MTTLTVEPSFDSDRDALTSVLTQTLEAQGVLGKVRAELRASVFTAIHEQQVAKGYEGPPALASLHRDSAGRLAAQLILELLEACELDFSLQVLRPEANLKGVSSERSAVSSALGLTSGSSEPLLIQLVRAALPGGGGLSAAPAPSVDAAAPPPPRPTTAPAASVSAAPVAATNLAANLKLAGTLEAESKPLGAPPLRASGPPSPPSPASPLLSNAPPFGKPKSTISGGGFLSDLPPLSGRGATVPPLAGLGALPSAPPTLGGGGVGGGGGAALSPSASGSGLGGLRAPASPEGGGDAHEERRLDALESKLSSLAGLPPRGAAGANALAPIGALGRHPPAAKPGLAGGGFDLKPSADVQRTSGADSEEVEIEDDIAEESFEEDDDDESMSLDASSGPPLQHGLSPSHPMPRTRQRLSPLDASTPSVASASGVSLDESMSPSTLSYVKGGFDLAESVEMPRPP